MIIMINALLSLFYPRLCLSCKELLLEKENMICASCYHHLSFTEMYKIDQNILQQMFYGRVHLIHASAILYFNKNNVTQKLIHQLKYKGEQEIGALLALLYETELTLIHQKNKFDVVVPIPLHPRKFKLRGYNQLTFFGNEISRILKIPMADQLLLKHKETQTQTIKNKEERTKMDDEVFFLKNPEEYANKHILLIDDVVTTGSTLENALNILSKIKNVQLSIITMAMTDHS